MYNYEKMKEELFTDKGQQKFIKVRDKVFDLLDKAGAVRIQEVLSSVGGDAWLVLACFDRMVEWKELKEITSGTTAGQYRVFVKA